MTWAHGLTFDGCEWFLHGDATHVALQLLDAERLSASLTSAQAVVVRQRLPALTAREARALVEALLKGAP